MAKERLSQVQKAILLIADELSEEQSQPEIRFRRLVKRLAIKADRIHERSKCMLPKYLVTISRSVRNMERKGMLKLHFSCRLLSHTFNTKNIRSISLTPRPR